MQQIVFNEIPSQAYKIIKQKKGYLKSNPY